METKETRPRDEDFENIQSVSEKKDADEEEAAEDSERPRVWVVLLIIAAGAVFAICATLIFYGFKSHQKTVVVTPSSSVVEEVTETESETVEETEADETAAP